MIYFRMRKMYPCLIKSRRYIYIFILFKKLSIYTSQVIDTILLYQTKKDSKSKNKTNECSFEDFETALKYCECNLESKYFDFIIMKNQEISQSIEIIQYLKLLKDVFKNKIAATLPRATNEK